MSSKKTTTDSNSATDIQINPSGERLPASRFALFFGLLIAGTAADLATKSWMFNRHYNVELAHARVRQNIGFWWIEGVFGVQTSTNPGALFGMGAGLSYVFATFSIVALTGILVWLFLFRAAADRWLTIALGLVSGGIIGNLYDRVGLGWKPEYPEWVRDNVRDWIYFRLEGVPFFDPWPNFNIADSLLVVGAAMLFVHSFVLYRAEIAAEADAS